MHTKRFQVQATQVLAGGVMLPTDAIVVMAQDKEHAAAAAAVHFGLLKWEWVGLVHKEWMRAAPKSPPYILFVSEAL